jgi:uncharacterized protein (TIGR02270 family)
MPPIVLHSRAILEPIVAQHAEEAAFLWTQRDRATEAPNFAPRHLRRLEERVAAHLSGLVVAGAAGSRLAVDQWRRQSGPGETFAAFASMLLAGDTVGADAFLQAAAPTDTARRGLSAALGWCPPAVSAPLVRRWAGSPAAYQRWLVLCACSHHRADAGPLLNETVSDEVETIRARALRLAGEIGRHDLLPQVVAAIDDPAPDPAFWAAWSCLLLGDAATALPRLHEVAVSPTPRRLIALEAAVRGDTPAGAIAWVRALNGDPARARLTVRALGHVGDAASIPWLIGRMDDPSLARLAGASFSMITGADLLAEKLDRPPPADPPATPNDDPADERVALDPDDPFPWPHPARVAAWWQDRHDRFRAGVRHLAGAPIDAAAVERVWDTGTQPQRRAAAYELARSRRQGLRNWRARVG